MLISFLRTIILYLLLIASIRLMGKRQLGEMEPTEFVVTMLVANLAAVPMQESGIPLLAGAVPILVVLAMELLLSVLSYHSIKFRRLICGKPVILIENGRLMQRNLQKTRVTPDELTEYLRLQGVVAILETSGNVSVLLYPKYEPASAKEAGVQVDDLHLPITLISGGRLLRENLDLLGKSEAWVRESLSAYNCEIRDVFLLTCEPGGKLYLSIREDAT